MNHYTELDATALAERVRKREVHPKELVQVAVASIEKVNPVLNAVVLRLYEKALANATGALHQGPFTGVPFVVKDLDGYLAGEPYTQSCRFLASFVPDHDSEIIARMKRTGILIVAKTSTPEFGILGVTESAMYGATRNPWAPQRSPCGSSGGTAALVASRAVPLGHGGDGGGSIRVPASACGLFGFKPSRGRNPVGPDLGEGWGGYVQPHVLARSVRDSAVMLDATQGPEAGAPYAAPPPTRAFVEELHHPPGRLRIAFSTGSLYGKTVHPDCVAAVKDAARLCAHLGHEVTEASPVFNRDEMVHAYLVQVAASVATTIAEAERLAGRKANPSCFEATTWLLGQIGRKMSATDLQQSRDACHRLGRLSARFFQTHDVFLNATLGDLPAHVGQLALKPLERFGMGLLRALPARSLLERVLAELGSKHLERTPNTMFFNQTGQPAMSVPLCFNDEGLPVGVQFAAGFGDEVTLFRLAAQLEKERPWLSRKPTICA